MSFPGRKRYSITQSNGQQTCEGTVESTPRDDCTLCDGRKPKYMKVLPRPPLPLRDYGQTCVERSASFLSDVALHCATNNPEFRVAGSVATGLLFLKKLSASATRRRPSNTITERSATRTLITLEQRIACFSIHWFEDTSLSSILNLIKLVSHLPHT